jgi:hypothetical protein
LTYVKIYIKQRLSKDGQPDTLKNTYGASISAAVKDASDHFLQSDGQTGINVTKLFMVLMQQPATTSPFVTFLRLRSVGDGGAFRPAGDLWHWCSHLIYGCRIAAALAATEQQAPLLAIDGSPLQQQRILELSGYPSDYAFATIQHVSSCVKTASRGSHSKVNLGLG